MTEPLRICHLGKYYPPAPGGIETYVQTLARAQAALGHDVRVVVVNHLDNRGRNLMWKTLGTSRTHDESDGPVRVTRISRVATCSGLDICPGLTARLGRLQKEADVFHLQTPNPTMILALAALPLRIPLFITHQSDIIRQKNLKHPHAPFQYRVYSRAARIFPTSPTYAAGSAILQAHKERVEPLPLSLNLDPYLHPSPAALAYAAELRQKYGAPIWSGAGRLVYYKAFHIAIEALAHVPGTLIIVGTGPLEKDLRALAARLNLTERVVFAGHASPDQLVGIYHASTAFWFPSTFRSEAFGLVQVEAMASRCPVINAAIPDSGVTWVSPHDKTGLTVPLNDPQALAAAARRMLEEPALHDRLADAGPIHAVENFDHLRSAARCIHIYQSILNAREARAPLPAVPTLIPQT